MFDVLAGRYLTTVLRGAAAALFGFVALLMPQLTLDRLAALFAVYAIADGVLALLSAVRVRRRDAVVARFALTDGAIGIGTGALALGWPELTLLALLLVIAVRALGIGAAWVAAAVHLWRETLDARAFGVGGIVSVGFGLTLIVFPAAGVLGLVWWIAAFAIAAGAALVGLALRARRTDDSESELAVAS